MRERVLGPSFASLAAAARRCLREADASPPDAAVIRTTPMCAAARCDPVFARCRDRTRKRRNAPRGPATYESVAKEQGAAMNTGGLNHPDEK